MKTGIGVKVNCWHACELLVILVAIYDIRVSPSHATIIGDSFYKQALQWSCFNRWNPTGLG